MAVRYDIEAYKGDNLHTDPVQFLRGAVPLDLTNLVGKCQVRSVSGNLITELNVVVDDAQAGRYHLSATAAIMSLFPTTGNDLNAFEYDVQWTGAGNYIQTSSYGTFYVRPGVTE
jgi:hypothetical protein